MFRNIHRRTPVLEHGASWSLHGWSLFLIKMKASFLLPQVFSCGYCEVFKSTYLYRIPPVAASISQDWNPFLYLGLLLQSLKSSNAS